MPMPPPISTTGRSCWLTSIVNIPAGAFTSILSPTASRSWKWISGSPRKELPIRETYGVPPYGRIVRVIARGPAEATVQSYMNDLGAAFRAAADRSVRILGPAPAPIVKIRNLYRFHLQLRCPKSKPLQVLTATVPIRHPAPAHVEVAVDVDPISTL